ncbi:MAG: 30S ribosomal protein S12 methylthiotransferase RimO [Tannerellaceae bacterium]|jgi:ribosomal protein S12 methylthiotransferase|nr:30S ribosomal protein S12 methylthiotransferase RimO [Tannerellaceae bacterium]
MKKNKVDIITLGCSKNLVDSEQLMRQFAANGYRVEHDPAKINAEIVVINTCGFVADAQEESIRMILEIGEAKKQGQIAQLYVMGCLPERFAKEMQDELPEVDRFYGKFNWKELLTNLGKSYHQDIASERLLTTPAHYAYLKIAEGCDRSCSYCAIPVMTGRYHSRSIEDIEHEVRTLTQQGVKEFQVIAQDLTYYGIDRYKRLALPELIERLSDVPGVEWIRLHYAYPALFPFDLLRVMRERKNVCNYLDIALQHINDTMLKRMRRNITKEETYHLLERIRNEVPGIHLRTTLMVGHPGETEKEFAELVDFVQKIRFERMGAFIYSHEEGTYSYNHYQDDVPTEIKHERIDTLMHIQDEISTAINEDKEGTILKVIVDREEEEFYIGRTEYDSPEVDNEVLISKEETLIPGQFYNVRIHQTDPFDLYGQPVKS